MRDPQGTLISMVSSTVAGNTSARYYLTDTQDSVLATLDANNGTATRYLYEPYGQQIRTWIDSTPANNTNTGGTPPDGSETTPASTSADPSPWRYASGYQDPSTGFLKYGTRYYMPSLGRWTQIDPKAGKPENPLTQNPYLYTEDNPINSTDATGRLSIGDGFEALGGAFGIAGSAELGATLGIEGAAALGEAGLVAGGVILGVTGVGVAIGGIALGAYLVYDAYSDD